MRCTVCDELDGVSPKALKNPAALKRMKGSMALEHATCEQFRGNPARAKLERQFKKRMQAEFRGISS